VIKDFQTLSQVARSVKGRSIKGLFDNDDNRARELSLSVGELFLDYSKQNISKQELNLLCHWARSSDLQQHIIDMFEGKKINNTEDRAVLHTVLRAPDKTKKQVLSNSAREVIETEEKVAAIVDGVHSGQLRSASGKKFTDVIAIGIGGSYYGIKVGLSALHPYQQSGLNVHVLANVDGAAVEKKLKHLCADTTLVVVISKTFTTQETMLNANAVKTWMLSAQPAQSTIEKQWFAVSTNIEAATAFGLLKSNILPMWDWVGGRFSLWSAVGLPLALAIGNENFLLLKQGAYQMDEHFAQTDFESNMPVILALLGIWNRNGFDYASLAILPYDHSLRALPGYLQQTDMESNGKLVSKQGDQLPWQTAPVVFGQEGTNGQHAFMQLMHQSAEVIPTDFIVSVNGSSKLDQHHQVLVANCFAQSEALMQGKTLEQAENELIDKSLTREEVNNLAPHKVMKGNTPSNTLLIDKITPHSFGGLLALYEHKIFVQGVLWQLNSFDQWGVELGKELGNQILAVINGGIDESLSSSSQQLIEKFQTNKSNQLIY